MWYDVKIVSCLATEAIEGSALALESIHNVERCDGLAFCVLGVGDSVADNAVEVKVSLLTRKKDEKKTYLSRKDFRTPRVSS